MTDKLQQLREDAKSLCKCMLDSLEVTNDDKTLECQVFDLAALPLMTTLQQVYHEYYKLHLGKKVH